MTTELITFATLNAIQPANKTFDTSILTGQVRQSTIAMYKRDFAAYVDFAGGSVSALDAAFLAQWRTELSKTNKSPNKAAKNLR